MTKISCDIRFKIGPFPVGDRTTAEIAADINRKLRIVFDGELVRGVEISVVEQRSRSLREMIPDNDLAEIFNEAFAENRGDLGATMRDALAETMKRAGFDIKPDDVEPLARAVLRRMNEERETVVDWGNDEIGLKLDTMARHILKMIHSAADAAKSDYPDAVAAVAKQIAIARDVWQDYSTDRTDDVFEKINKWFFALATDCPGDLPEIDAPIVEPLLSD